LKISQGTTFLECHSHALIWYSCQLPLDTWRYIKYKASTRLPIRLWAVRNWKNDTLHPVQYFFRTKMLAVLRISPSKPAMPPRTAPYHKVNYPPLYKNNVLLTSASFLAVACSPAYCSRSGASPRISYDSPPGRTAHSICRYTRHLSLASPPKSRTRKPRILVCVSGWGVGYT
jgi:hypothetical protein